MVEGRLECDSLLSIYKYTSSLIEMQALFCKDIMFIFHVSFICTAMQKKECVKPHKMLAFYKESGNL